MASTLLWTSAQISGIADSQHDSKYSPAATRFAVSSSVDDSFRSAGGYETTNTMMRYNNAGSPRHSGRDHADGWAAALKSCWDFHAGSMLWPFGIMMGSSAEVLKEVLIVLDFMPFRRKTQRPLHLAVESAPVDALGSLSHLSQLQYGVHRRTPWRHIMVCPQPKTLDSNRCRSYCGSETPEGDAGSTTFRTVCRRVR
jgi:hypothetical protein